MDLQRIEDCKFMVLLKCSECGHQLNSTKKITYEEIQHNWPMIVMNSGFNAGRCPKGCEPTFSDLNIHARLETVDAKTNKPVEYQLFKFLSGNFYSDDRNKICLCDKRPSNEVYCSKKYPAVHGRCGCWLEQYRN